MIRNEERTGLVLTVAGGAGLLLLLLWLLGFFSSSAPPPKATVHATPKRSGSVAGELVDAKSGRAIDGASIEITGLDGVSDHWLAPPDPDRPLHFEMKSVPAERDCALEIAAPGYATARRPARVAAGATVDVGTVKLVPLATILGSTVDANDAALAGADVVAERVEPNDPKAAAESGDAWLPELPSRVVAKSDVRGAFHFEGLAPARWRVQATTAEGERVLDSKFVDASSGGATEPVEIELFATVAVKGRVNAAAGAELPTEVRLDGRSAPIGADGTFALSGVFEGMRRLDFVGHAGIGSSNPVPVPSDALDLDAASFGSSRDAGYSTDGSSDRGSREIVVRVLDETGRPLAGAAVHIERGDTYRQTRFTARNGQALLRGIPDDCTNLTFIEASFGTRKSFNDRKIPTASKGTGAPFELRCLPTHALTVKVVAPDGSPVAHARVGVHDPSARLPMAQALGPRSLPKMPSTRYATTDASGAARFESLPPPPWQFRVDDTEFEPSTATDAQPDADDTITVQLAKKGGG